MEPIPLYVDVPMCSFRPRWAREYQETYPVPPPATVYGMLLALVGVDWDEKPRHAGTRLAIAIGKEPEQSRIFRKFRRVPQSGKHDALVERRPDYQELLLWLKLWVWVDDGESEHPLTSEIEKALGPGRSEIVRYGGLSLGESSHLVNEITIRKPKSDGRYLSPQTGGRLNLPVWVHHQRDGKGSSRLANFDLGETQALETPSPDSNLWIRVGPGDDRAGN